MSERRPRFDLWIRHGVSMERLTEAVRTDSAIRAEAEAELEALAPISRDRCVMSHEYREILREALGQT